MYTGKCGHAYERLNFQRGCGDCPAVREYPKSLYFDRTKMMFEMKKRLLKDYDSTIITPSLWLADRVRLSFLKNKRIRVIHNGVDTSVFHPVDSGDLRKELKVPEDYRIVLAVAPGIMSEAKGGQWVLKLAEEMKNEKAFFILVGSGATPNALPDKTLFIGEVKDQKLLAQYYSMADVFLMLSRRETYSMTCAEALCCGTPVVGFKSGVPETVFLPPMAEFVNYGKIDLLYDSLHRRLGELKT